MGKKDYVEVGEVLTRKHGKRYLVVAKFGCDSCAFNHKVTAWCDDVKCCKEDRADHINVVFHRIADS